MPVNLEREQYIYKTDGANPLKSEVRPLVPQLRLVTDSYGGDQPPLLANIISLTEFKAKKAEHLISQRKTLLPSATFLRRLRKDILQVSTVIKKLQPENLTTTQVPVTATPESHTTPKESQKLHPGQMVEGQLLVCDVSLYRNLYNEYMEFSKGDKEMARRNVLLAIIKDSTSLVQENISALTEKDKFGKEKRVVDDDRIQAELQQTPTVHEFIETIDPRTGERILCSPEHLELRKSYLKTITRFRRGNDLEINRLLHSLVLDQPITEEGLSTLTVSPPAEEWEGPWVNKYQGEYGFAYGGEVSLTEQFSIRDVSVEAGLRRILIHSVKVDGNTGTFSRFMNNMGGESHQASFDDIDTSNPYSPSKDKRLDVLMRTGKTFNERFSVKQWISALYKAKGEVEGVNEEGNVTMFGIKEETMLDVQNPELIKRVEKEISVPVAHWLLEQIENGVSSEVIQSKIRNKYISEVKKFVERVKAEREENRRLTIYQESANRTYDGTSANSFNKMGALPISAAEMALAEDLRRRTQTKGAFCGTWGESSSSLFSTNSITDLSNYKGLSGNRINSLGGGGVKLSSGEITHCTKCKEEICGGRCATCNINYN